MDRVIRALDPATGGRPPGAGFRLTRRQLWTLAGLAGAAGVGLACEGLVEQISEQIRNRPVRREINSLAPDDRIIRSYRAAVTAMRNLPSSDRRNWTRQAEIHFNFCRHRSWLTWPWHRAYLHYFEQICRELSGDDQFALPYWNWTANRRVPAVFWDQSSPLFHPGRVATSTSEANASSVGQDVINNALATSNFILFAGSQVGLNHPPTSGPGMGPLESGPHNYIHPFVGGDMGTFMSPLDPVFWLHHARLDQLWVEWNVVRENPNTNHSDWTNTEFTEFAGPDGSPVSVRVSLTTLFPLLSYRYDTQEVV